MLLVDFNQIFLSSIFSQLKQTSNFDANLVRHIVLSCILSYRNKWGNEYGDLVFCCDGKNYWRKEKFKYYKANRKKSRDSSGLNWTPIFDALNTIRAELKDNMPYRLIEIETAEADDIIATLCKTFHDKEKILILSGDRDFVALQKYPNVKQYSPVQKIFVSTDNPEVYLKNKILSGDRGDGIPNLLSDDDCFVVPGKRQSRMTQKRLDYYLRTPIEKYEEGPLKNFRRNELLIDLSNVPSDLEHRILECYKEQTPSKKNMMKYFLDKRLTLLLEHLNNF